MMCSLHDTAYRENSTGWRFCTILWIMGIIGLPLAHWFLLAKIEPFYSAIYTFLWWSFIFVADFGVYLLRKRSLLHDRPREFLFLALWSAPVWLLFEMLNLRLENWYYVMVPPRLSLNMFLVVTCFATVLPGLFETTELVIGIIERTSPGASIRGPHFTISRSAIRNMVIAGGIMLILVLVKPRWFFPLTWGFAFLLIDPICYARGGRSLLGQLSRGDYTRLVALLTAGFICGGLWEAWNISARSKWIYTVPFFDELKLGEMPVLGFVGFPPFVLECYAIVNGISLLRGGRHWELSRSQNREQSGMSISRVVVLASATVLFIAVAGYLVVTNTVSSRSIPLDRYFSSELDAAGKEALHHNNALHSHLFLRLEERPEEIPPETYNKIHALSKLAEVKGMGLKYAEMLYNLGITSLETLARQYPATLTATLQEISGKGRAPRKEQVKVWIQAARHKK